MSRTTRRIRTIAALTAVSALCGGCAIPLVTALPSVLGASPVVADYLEAGRIDSFWVAGYDDVLTALMRAEKRLSLNAGEKTFEDGRATLRYTDDLENKIDIRIERQTETVTRARIDVGSDRFLGLARLIGRQVVAELNDMNGFRADWSRED